MFHSIKRLLHWAGGYRKRLYLGCLCSFFSVWCTAIPIVIAAWTLGLVIADFRGISTARLLVRLAGLPLFRTASNSPAE